MAMLLHETLEKILEAQYRMEGIVALAAPDSTLEKMLEAQRRIEGELSTLVDGQRNLAGRLEEIGKDLITSSEAWSPAHRRLRGHQLKVKHATSHKASPPPRERSLPPVPMCTPPLLTHASSSDVKESILPPPASSSAVLDGPPADLHRRESTISIDSAPDTGIVSQGHSQFEVLSHGHSQFEVVSQGPPGRAMPRDADSMGTAISRIPTDVRIGSQGPPSMLGPTKSVGKAMSHRSSGFTVGSQKPLMAGPGMDGPESLMAGLGDYGPEATERHLALNTHTLHSLEAMRIRITVDRAEHISNESVTDKCDPFCIIKLGLHKKSKTPVLKNAGANPKWHFECEFDYDGEEEIEFCVMDFNRLAEHHLCGQAVLPITLVEDGFHDEIELIKHKGMLSCPAGHLFIAVNWIHPAGYVKPHVTKKATDQWGNPEWPANIPLRKGLDRDFLSNNEQNLCQVRASLSMKSEKTHEYESQSSAFMTFLDGAVWHPTSTSRFAFDVMSMLVVLHDSLVIPYACAWDASFAGWLKIGAWAAVLFWTLDIAASFFTGYLTDGEVETRFTYVASHYMRTWFFWDMILVLIDWVCLVVLNSGDRVHRLIKFVRVVRMLRMLGLFRIVRVAMIFEHILDRSLSDTWRVLVQIVKLCLLIMWLGHMSCCIWFFIGLRGKDITDTGAEWFLTADVPGRDFADAGHAYQYFTSFHWSMSQITAGGVESLSPVNSLERAYGIVCLIFGFVFGSAIISMLSASMIEFQMMIQEKSEKVRVLRRFLHENLVEAQLAVRVQREANLRMSEEMPLTMRDVGALEHLSEHLLSELQFSIVGKHLVRHPLFRLCADLDVDSIQNLCRDAVELSNFSDGHILCRPGIVQDDAFLIVQGRVVYTQKPATSKVEKIEETRLMEGHWLCKVAIWANPWVSVGTAETVTPCQILVIHAPKLIEVMLNQPIMKDVLQEWAFQFHHRLVQASPPVPWPTDVHVPFTEYSEIVLSMRHEVRVIVGTIALRTLHQRPRRHLSAINGMLFGDGVEDLEEEIESGESTVMVGSSGEVERVVALVALDIKKASGQRFVQLGKFVKGKVSGAQCRLPGEKQIDGEVPWAAMRRHLNTTFAMLTRGLQITHSERSVQWSDSQRFNIKTKYLKTTFHGVLDCSMFEGDPLQRFKLMPHLESTGSASGLPTWEVYLLGNQRSVRFFAWIPDEEFPRLSVDDEFVRKWLDGYVHSAARSSCHFHDLAGHFGKVDSDMLSKASVSDSFLLPKCRTEGCLYTVHSQEQHGFCCASCRRGHHDKHCEMHRYVAPPVPEVNPPLISDSEKAAPAHANTLQLPMGSEKAAPAHANTLQLPMGSEKAAPAHASTLQLPMGSATPVATQDAIEQPMDSAKPVAMLIPEESLSHPFSLESSEFLLPARSAGFGSGT